AAMAMMHRALLIGCVLVGIVFWYLVAVQHQVFVDVGPMIGNVLAAVAACMIAIGGAVLRPRVPVAKGDPSPDTYWETPATRGSAILLWAVIEAGVLIGWMGYLLAHVIPPAIIAVFGVIVLWYCRPGSLQSTT